MQINANKYAKNVHESNIFIRTLMKVTKDKSIIFPAVTFIG